VLRERPDRAARYCRCSRPSISFAPEAEIGQVGVAAMVLKARDALEG
jgi:hypothetical protein